MLKKFLSLILIIVFLALGLYGLKPSTFDSATKLGYFKLAPFLTGFALYQDDYPEFYNFSPYNDYLVDKTGTYSSLVTKEEITNHSYKYNYFSSNLQTQIDYFLSFLNLHRPTIHFVQLGTIMSYQTNFISKNSFILTRTLVNHPHVKNAQATAHTLSYSCGDFLFDPQFNLYTQKTEADQSLFSQVYHRQLKSVTFDPALNGYWQEIPAYTLYILNPNMAGIIKVTASNNQKFKINPAYCLLAVEQPINPASTIKTQISVNLLNDINQIP